MGVAVFQYNFIYGHWNWNFMQFSDVRKYSFVFSPQLLKNVKVILCSQVVQKQAVGQSL